jgi:ABC-2 type transport system ATP-binding protein
VHRPPVLYLDEPTTGLDPTSRADLWTAVRELVEEGTTVLLTTQYLEEADELADRIVVMSKGRAVADGAAADLKSRFGRSVVEIAMDGPEAADAAAGVLARLDWEPASEGGRVRVPVSDGAASVVRILRALDRDGLPARSASVREPTLDDVFRAVTGEGVPDDGARPDPAELAPTEAA